MRELLAILVDAIARADRSPSFIFIGDYVNRGPDSRGVIDFLLKLPNARFCRGNHDDVFDVILNGQSFAQEMTHNNRPAAFKWFMEHGIGDTLASYGVSRERIAAVAAAPTRAGVDEVIAPVPQSHRQFIRNLVPVIEEPDLFIMHARWDPAMPDVDPSLATFLEVDDALHKTAIWGRYTIEEIDAVKSWKRTGFFGHTPVDGYGARGGYDPHGGGQLKPIVGDKIVLLDTAAALSPVGRLTAWCAETKKYIQVDRQRNVLA